MNCQIKYKPNTLADVIYPNESVREFINTVARGDLIQNIIFYGPNGTGKSTVADLLPYAISGESAIVEEKDYSELLDQKDLKDYLERQYRLSTLGDREKTRYYLVLHEFDNATKNLVKLWTALDSFADRMTLFATTNNQMAIHQSIRSRCRCVEFPAISVNSFLPRATSILANENIAITQAELVKQLSVVKTGDLRGYLNQLDDLIATRRTPIPPKRLQLTVL